MGTHTWSHSVPTTPKRSPLLPGFTMPAGPITIDLTHRDAPIEISDDSDNDDAELPVAIEPPQPVSLVVRQRNVNERRARLLQRGIDEEAEDRARQRQI